MAGPGGARLRRRSHCQNCARPGAELAYLTVEEAARRLGVSPATVRSRCKSGSIAATKSGGRWLIDASAIHSHPTTPVTRTTLADRIDLDGALAQIERLDLIEEWVPDILRHEDQLADRSGVIDGARRRVAGLVFDPPREVEVPKTPFFTRTGRLLSLEERVAFHAVVASFAPAADSSLSKNVYSARLATRGAFFTRKGTLQWKRWLRHVRRHLRRGEPWLIKTDLTAYFDTIKFDLLDAELQSLSISTDAREAISAMLQSWTPLQGAGLLQGPDAARILGNLYLAPVDAMMDYSGVSYSRYMDDVRITGRTKSSVISGLQILERECRNRGLILSPNKTTLHSGRDALNDDAEKIRDAVLYFLRVGNFTQAKRRLRRLLKDSIADDGHLNARNFRFSLWRLTKYRDHYVLPQVLARLDDLAPAASVVAQYLRPFISKPKVEVALSDFLTAPDNVRHNHLVFFLFAVMLDHEGPPPAQWTAAADSLMRDPAAPKELRGVAANLAARSKSASVISWLRSTARSNGDQYFVRCLLTALARVGALDAATAKTVRTRGPLLARAVDYLEQAETLPSLASIHDRVPIP